MMPLRAPKLDDAQPARDRLSYYAAIEKQLTEETWRIVRAYARRCASILQREGIVADDEQLVADAVSDTTTGDRRWDTERWPLSTHLCGVIDSRTKHRLKHERRCPKVSIDWHRVDDDGAGEHVLPPAADDPEAVAMRGQMASLLVARLYQEARAKKDRILVGILDLYRDGVRDRAEIANELGIRPAAYDDARRRLVRMIDKLPNELRDDAQELLMEIA